MNLLPDSPTTLRTSRSECFSEDLCPARHCPPPRAQPGPRWSRCVFWCAAALAAASLTGAARADTIVSYVYAGVVDDDEGGRGWTRFTGQIAFDRWAVDVIADPNTADYKISDSPSGHWPSGMNVTFDNGDSVSFNHYFDILVTNNVGGTDQWGAQAHDAGSSDSLGVTLFDFSQSVFASDALPLPPGGLTLASFSWTAFKYESAAGLLAGHLTGLTCVAGCDGLPAVPEPQAWALWLTGLGTLATWAHRRRAT
jgi:hypothetical protein